MKIAIDLNDVVRDYSKNFAKYFHENYDHSFDFNDFEIWTNDMKVLFPFKSDESYERFVYQDYSYELFSCCPTTYPSLTADFNHWIDNDVKNVDTDDKIELMIVSTMEYGLSIPSTYVFLGKLGIKVREIYLPSDSSEIWNRCDVLVTANPKMLDSKPEGKITVKIDAEYNSESEGDFEFKSFKNFITEKNNIEKLLEKKYES